MRVGIAAFVVVCVLWVTPSQADFMHVFVKYGELNVLANTPNQHIPVMVEGDGLVQGLNFFVAVASTDPKVTKVPTITANSLTAPDYAVDIVGPNTLFEGNHTDQYDAPGWMGGYPSAWYAVTTTLNNTVTPGADTWLANVTIDTTGIFTGEYYLKFSGIDLGGSEPFSTDFAGWESPDNVPTFDDNPDLIQGLGFLVPEPSSFLLMFAGIVGLGIVTVARRKR
jgi:hypothetical protein